MFRNILFPTDFTPHARSALKYAAAFAREGRGRVIVFSVQTGKVPANLMTLPERILRDQEKNWLLQLRSQVQDVLQDELCRGLQIEPVIVEGEPGPEIAKAARDYDIDLVTVVTHGRRGLARALFGSTAEEIIAEAPCPVLTIRPPQHDFVHHRGPVVDCSLQLLAGFNLYQLDPRAAQLVVERIAVRLLNNDFRFHSGEIRQLLNQALVVTCEDAREPRLNRSCRARGDQRAVTLW